jgi:hypothetical protein
MGAKENAHKRAAKAAAAKTGRAEFERRIGWLHASPAAAARHLNMGGGTDIRVDLRDLDGKGTAYVDGKGNPVSDVTEGGSTRHRFPAGRPKREHSLMIPTGGISTRL